MKNLTLLVFAACFGTLAYAGSFSTVNVAPDGAITLSPWTGDRVTKQITQPRAASSPFAVTSNGVVFSPAPYPDIQRTAVCKGQDGKDVWAYISRGYDGKFSVIQADANIPLLAADSSLPGGHTIVSSKGAITPLDCYVNTGSSATAVFFTFDPNRVLNGQPYLALRSASAAAGLNTWLETGVTSFSANDPKNGSQTTTYTYIQATGLEVRGNRVVPLVVSNPAPTPGFPGAPIPELQILQMKESQTPDVLLNNARDDKTNWFGALVNYCITDNTMYVAGQAADSPPSSKTALAVYRIVNGSPVRIRGYGELVWSGISCGSAGVQVTSLDTSGPTPAIRVEYFSDTTPPDGTSLTPSGILVFKGAAVADVGLSTQDVPYLVGPGELYVTTQSRALIRIRDGQGTVLHTPPLAPQGNAFTMAVVNGQVLYIQTEGGSNHSYWLYQPPQTIQASGRPGDQVQFVCPDCVVAAEGKVPSLNLVIAGQQIPITSAVSGSTITFSFIIPATATPGRIDSPIDVVGVKVTASLTVRAATEPPSPRLVSAVNQATGLPGPFAPRMRVQFSFTGPLGVPATADPNNPVFELGGVSVSVDGAPFRVLNNSGTGVVTALVPAIVGLKTNGNVTIWVRDPSGVVVSSVPFKLTFAPRADSLYQVPDPFDGTPVPYLVDDQGRLVGSQLSPAQNGSNVTGYGTGCGLPVDLGDGQNVQEPGIDIPSPTAITVGGMPATSQSTTLAPPAGLCIYKFGIPTGLSGKAPLWFGGGNPIGLIYSLSVQ